MLFGNNLQSLNVIDMLVRDEDRTDIGKGRTDGEKTFFDGAGADARVDQNFRIGSFHIEAIA
jgi:hypothetical protein